ncbi:cullin-2-like [Oscarella lobularis]|uniref:cullin-2-like n=1 Tax=Oscarella lobularis TaxID=121494 RepID=UPI00331321B3
MSLRPRQVEFKSVWSDVHATCLQVVRLGNVEKKTWNDRFSDVYALCVAFPEPLTDLLYDTLKMFLEEHVTKLKEVIESSSSENLLFLYQQHWSQFSQGTVYLNHLFRYLNSQYNEKNSFNAWMDVTPYSFGSEFQERQLDIGPLALNSWKVHLILHMKDNLVGSLVKEIRNDRQGKQCNSSVVQGVIDSFVRVEEHLPKQAHVLKFYQEVFETPLLNETGDYYKFIASQLLAESSCSEYMKKVVKILDDEKLRVKKFFHHSSHAKVVRETEGKLVEDHLEFLQGECRTMVKDGKYEDLSRMYQLLKPIPEGLKVILTELESHIQETGLGMIRAVPSEKNPAEYVEALLALHDKYADVVSQTFHNDKVFVGAMDKGCAAVVNHTENPRVPSKSAELLARYCDSLLKKGTKNASDQEVEDSLAKVIVVFKYVEDKDIFQKFYSKMLAKRLIHGLSVSSEAEENMISRLKHMCGFEYTNKLHRMFTDMSLSDDLNASFGEFLKEKTPLGLSFTVQILQSGAWPLGQAAGSPFTIPEELLRSISSFESFYNTRFSGRKLTWLHHLCTGELKATYLKRPYAFTVTVYQMGVLLVFNHTDSSTSRELQDVTGLSDKEIKRTLQSLVDVKLLVVEELAGGEKSYGLNLQFANKRTKLKITAAVQRETPQEVAQTHSAIDEDRKLYLQAAIVRIMKLRKVLKHNLLIQEVISLARSRFSPSISSIKKSIESLIEKQYLERREDSKDEYNYLA